MYPPEPMQSSSSSQSQHSIMQRLLTGGNGVASSPAVPGPPSLSPHAPQMTSAAVAAAAARNGGIEDIAARLHRQQNGTGSYANGQFQEGGGHWSGSDNLGISNNTPLMHLTCDDCGVFKTNSEDMEVHIKMEHLNWLPFQCPICLSERASDAQMREHLHSAHRKNMNKFIYVDNVSAKRQLQLMMDRALSSSLLRRAGTMSASRQPLAAGNSLTQLAARPKDANDAHEPYHRVTTLDISDSPPAEPSPGISHVMEGVPRKRPHMEVSSGNTNTDALLASISRAATGAGVIDGEVMTDIGNAPMSINAMFNNKKIKSEMDHLLEEQQTADYNSAGYADESSVLDRLNPISVLDDVAALFATSDGRIEESFSTPTHGEKVTKPYSAKAASSQVSKKRVLGECSKCNKPVTAGARQMHMFFHLAKDHGTYRFRCMFEGCPVEHYRKDQMENHQSKIHGKIDPDMMEDRSLELFQRCQDLSMELLGTKSGSTPGPTAAKAELVYQAQQAAIREKEKARGGAGSNGKPAGGGVGTTPQRTVPDDEHPLECRLCHKTMQNRIRGFHILWHMAKDLGINRYICRFCGFGHDRSQSVQTHGKKEHGTEDVVQDRINEYEDEVKQMSEQCFGFQALFAQDNKRRSKIPVTVASSASMKKDKEAKIEVEEEVASSEAIAELSQGSSDVAKSREETPEDEEIEEVEQSEENEGQEDEETQVKPSRKRRHPGRFPRFGQRRPASKSKRNEMAKLREVSMILGGAQYYKKKVNETAICETCGKVTNSRLSEHAYTHMDEPLFLCPMCDLGHYSRDIVSRHIRDMHETDDRPVDNRLKFASGIKETVRQCYPAFFVDAPIPTAQDVEKLKQHIAGGTGQVAGVTDLEDEDEQEGEEEEYETETGVQLEDEEVAEQ